MRWLIFVIYFFHKEKQKGKWLNLFFFVLYNKKLHHSKKPGHTDQQNIAKCLFKWKRGCIEQPCCVTKGQCTAFLIWWGLYRLHVADDWVTSLTHKPNERKRTSNAAALLVTSFQGKVLFNSEPKRCKSFSDWKCPWSGGRQTHLGLSNESQPVNLCLVLSCCL